MSTKDTQTPIERNAAALERELDWLEEFLYLRLKIHFWKVSPNEENNEAKEPAPTESDLWDLSIPELSTSPDNSTYEELCLVHNFGPAERLTLALAITPHLRPQLLDPLFLKNQANDRHHTEFGGSLGERHPGFLPTGETLAFLLAPYRLDDRIYVQQIFGSEHPFRQQGILALEASPPGDPELSGLISISSDYLDYLTLGHFRRPNFSEQFPARRLTTDLEWEDLVLPHSVRAQVEHIRTWCEHGETLLKTYGKRGFLKPGYRALFYGPPGTGKTLAATLIGKSTEKDVYLIDSSMTVSKWVGETEKNLGKIFDMAEKKDWILFFDEADTLFGKRGKSDGDHTRHGNQQVAYLLQRTENYPGTIILASNLKGNMDEAFMRRFQSVVYFPMPSPRERLYIWRKTFFTVSGAESIDFEALAKKYELTGGSIVNVLKYALLRGQARVSELEKGPRLDACDLLEGAKAELEKLGRQG